MSTSIHTGICLFVWLRNMSCHILSYSVCILKEIFRKYNTQKYWMDGKNILKCILILQCWFRLARDEEMLTATMIRFVEEPRFKMEISQDGHKRVKVKA